MSRSGYVDDLDSNVLNLYRGRVARALRGKRGQAFLREMAAAMDAMPVKELIADDLVLTTGECCAIGSVFVARGQNVSAVDPEDPAAVAALAGIAPCMAAEIEWMNDEWSYNETDEQRWRRMRKWIDAQLISLTPRP